MIVFLRSHDIKSDGRLQKYISVLKKRNIDYKAIFWSRDKVFQNDNFYTSFNLRSETGRGLMNLHKIFLFNIWIFFKLFSKRTEIKTVHAVDLDTIIPALFFSKIFQKKLIYDIFDMTSESRKMNETLRKFFFNIERYIAKQADYLLLPHSIRFDQLDLAKNKSRIIIENVPMNYFSSKSSEVKFIYEKKFSYIGILQRKHRGIENIIEFFKANQDYTLDIAGHGELEEEIALCSKNYKNINFHGRLNYQDALSLMMASDVILGLYYKSIRNHQFASPNKYYEHLMIGKPLVTSFGTMPGNLVESFKTGWAVQDNYNSFENIMKSIDDDQIRSMSMNASTLWMEKYCNYDKEVLEKIYLEIIL
tara:strand:- start:933 stop:2021 length:1089 start_codon:yes stop_codon:yes gene_type:complete